MNGINLIPAHRRLHRSRRARRGIWIVVGTAYAAILLTVAVSVRLMWTTPGLALSEELDRAGREISDAQADQADLRRQLQRVAASLAAGQTVGTQPDWSILLSVMARQMGDDVVLDSFRLAGQGPAAGADGEPLPLASRPYTLQLSGMARDPLAVSNFVLRLERTGLFQRVTLGQSQRREVSGGEAVGFRIECRL